MIDSNRLPEVVVSLENIVENSIIDKNLDKSIIKNEYNVKINKIKARAKEIEILEKKLEKDEENEELNEKLNALKEEHDGEEEPKLDEMILVETNKLLEKLAKDKEFITECNQKLQDKGINIIKIDGDRDISVINSHIKYELKNNLEYRDNLLNRDLIVN